MAVFIAGHLRHTAYDTYNYIVPFDILRKIDFCIHYCDKNFQHRIRGVVVLRESFRLPSIK